MPQSFEQIYYEADSFWSGDALTDAGNQRRIKETAEIVPSDVFTLLDAGCGNGMFGAYLKTVRPGIKVLSVDRSEAALTHVTTDKMIGDVADLLVEDYSFDCVTCLEVLEHLPVKAFLAATAELARVSRKYIVIGVPYNEQIERNVTQCPQCKTLFNIDLHLHSFNEQDMRRLLEHVGFVHRRTIYPGHKQRLCFIDPLLDARERWRQRFYPTRFLSPICPLCGYSEGDRTALSLPSAQPVRANGNIGLARRVLRSIRKYWPTYYAPGYWVATLYERLDANAC
jgi:SAM-dependent methyltransferase